MAYVGKRKRSSMSSSYVPRKRTRYSAPSSKRAVPVPRKKATSYVRKNSLAINRIARVQRTLRNMSYGTLQTSFQQATRNSGGGGNLLQFWFDSQHPYLFDMGDFTRTTSSGTNPRVGCRIFGISDVVDSVSGTTTPTVTSQGHWQNAQADNSYYTGPQLDIIDTGKHLPVYGDYTFKFLGHAIKRPTRITLTTMVLKTRNFVNTHGNMTNRLLPTGLTQMRDMADPTKNQISKEFFKVYSNKVITLKPQGNTTWTLDGMAICKMSVRPKKLRTQDFTGPVDPMDPTPEMADGNYGHLNVPLGQPYWLLISTDEDPGNSSSVNMFISRKVAWRDHIGAA